MYFFSKIVSRGWVCAIEEVELNNMSCVVTNKLCLCLPRKANTNRIHVPEMRCTSIVSVRLFNIYNYDKR